VLCKVNEGYLRGMKAVIMQEIYVYGLLINVQVETIESNSS